MKSSASGANAESASINQAASGIDKQSVSYATESTIAAIANGKSAYQTAEGAASNFKSALTADAGRIAAIGAEFAEADKAISNSIIGNK